MSLADKRNRADQLRRELSAARVGNQVALTKAEEDIQSERLDKEIAALEAEIRLTQGAGGGSTADAKAAMEAAAAASQPAGDPVPAAVPSAPPVLGLTLDLNTGSEEKK